MTGFALKKELTAALANAGVEDAAFEAQQLLCHVTGKDAAAWLLAQNEPLDAGVREQLDALLHRRLSGEPLQYLLGQWDFFGAPFLVGDGVLIPRPETEALCETVIDAIRRDERPVVFDLCAGSGCIGLTVKRCVPQARVCLFEKFDPALVWLNRNRELHGLTRDVSVIQGDVLRGADLFSSLPRPDVIVSNPPYVESDALPTLQKEVRREPQTALGGGKDGLAFYRCFADSWYDFLKDGGLFAVECGDEQAEAVAGLFLARGADVEIKHDFNHIPRFVIARKEPT